ncbi:E3 ubiquitin-protein ligase ARIH1 [Pseudolycoriella hygida]|uniref:RBR-type E3 ubiquitin transferase n=1 Tax=Pseudolycoriella hygida TaxID=35572 RepID=A0A9Q0NDD5_9DIPT|nr:E3 ubiquitin-protein ligase ARIH1 [Pseudolycoriella hygida]
MKGDEFEWEVITRDHSSPMSELMKSPANPTGIGAISTNNNCTVLKAKDITECIREAIEDVNSILGLGKKVARLLLIHCKWDKVLLMEKFFNDHQKLYEEAHVINEANSTKSNTSANSESNECGICLCEMTFDETVTNSCEHKFCKTCWSLYLKMKIMTEGAGDFIFCPETKCNVLIDKDLVYKVLSGNDVVLKQYERLITNSFVQQNLLVRWCPGPGCKFAIRVEGLSFKPIFCKCECNHEFCFDCGDKWHELIPCDVLRKFDDDVFNGLFRSIGKKPAEKKKKVYELNIKRCPQANCSVYIQKMMGCNVVRCSNCYTVFCWDCMRCFKGMTNAYYHQCTEFGSGRSPSPVEDSEFIESEVLEEPWAESWDFRRNRRFAGNHLENMPWFTTDSTTDESDDEIDAMKIGFSTTPLTQRRLQNFRKRKVSPNHALAFPTSNGVMTRSRRHLGTVKKRNAKSRKRNASSKTSQSVPSSSQSVVSKSQSVASTSQSVASTSQNVASTSQSVASTSQRVASTSQRVASTSQSGAFTSLRVASTSQKLSKENLPSTSEEYLSRKSDTTRSRMPRGVLTRAEHLKANLAKTSQDFASTSQDFASTSQDFASTSQDFPSTLKTPKEENQKQVIDLDIYPAFPNDDLNPADRKIAYYSQYLKESDNFEDAMVDLTTIRHNIPYVPNPDYLNSFERVMITLCQCRYTLKYSSIFIMYLESGSEFFILKNLLKDLRDATNQLSGETSHYSTFEYSKQFPQLAFELERNCQLRRRAVLDHVDYGYDYDLWSFDGTSE